MVRTVCKGFLTVFLALSTLFTSMVGVFRTGDLTYGRKKIDLSQFTLVWNDEFDGDKLDRSKWGFEWWITARKGGYWHEDMVSVENGDLVIRTEYKEEPLEYKYSITWEDQQPYGPGYYSGQIVTRDKYAQKYGYFECRCVLPAGCGLWSAFWMSLCFS